MSTSFIGANNFIPLTKAKKLTKFFKEKKGELTNPHFPFKDMLPNSETFDRVAIDRLLELPGCVGIRIYLGLDEEFKLRLILVGVNDKGEDLIIPDSTSSMLLSVEGEATEGETEDDGGLVVEDGLRCPPACPTPSTLNP